MPRDHDARQPRDRAAQLWHWCLQEGGRYEEYSKRELAELIQSGQELPAELVQLVEKRCVAERCIKGGWILAD